MLMEWGRVGRERVGAGTLAQDVQSQRSCDFHCLCSAGVPPVGGDGCSLPVSCVHLWGGDEKQILNVSG